jgi:Tfp pilus assembly PilM family ATPase
MFGLFKKAEKRYIGLDLGESSIKLVDISNRDDRLTLNNYTELEIGVYAGRENGEIVKLGDKEMSQAIKDIYEASKSSCKNFVVSVPMQSCVIKSLDLPIETKSILDSIVPYEFSKGSMLKSYDFNINYNVVEETESKLSLLVVAIKQKDIDRISTIFTGIDHDVLRVEPSIFGLSRNIERLDIGSVNMIIDFGASVTSVLFVSANKVYMAQTFSKGVNQIILNIKNNLSVSFPSAKKFFFELDILNENKLESQICKSSFTSILEEVIHIQNNFYNKFSLKCSNIYISGGGSKINNIETMIKQFFPLMQVFKINGFERLFLPENLKQITFKHGGTFNNAIGVTLSEIE